MYLVNKIKQIINEKRQNIRSFLRKIRLRLTMNPQEVSHLKKTFHCNKKWYGSSYGGFYVNPDLINESSIVYSFGIGKDISFDRAIMKNHRCKVYGFDPTPKSIEYIKTNNNSLFFFNDYGISKRTGVEIFFLPENEKGVSASMTLNEFVSEDKSIEAKMKCFDDITREFGHQHIDVVKMDIEGSEYEVLETLIDSDVSITQLLVEFHDRYFEGEIKSKKIIELLYNKGFEIFAASLNYEEISFINVKLANHTQ
jgi:FkbM family methyltransferase